MNNLHLPPWLADSLAGEPALDINNCNTVFRRDEAEERMTNKVRGVSKPGVFELAVGRSTQGQSFRDGLPQKRG